MGNLYLITAVVLVLGLILGIVSSRFKEEIEEKSRYRYLRKDFLLSRAEHELFDVLTEILGYNYYVFPQVHLITLLDHKIKGQSWRGAFRHIDEKSVDFVICDKNYIKPLLAIELDDRTHSYESRMLRDEEVNRILQDAHLPLLRFENHGNFNKEDIKNQLFSILTNHKEQIITQ